MIKIIILFFVFSNSFAFEVDEVRPCNDFRLGLEGDCKLVSTKQFDEIYTYTALTGVGFYYYSWDVKYLFEPVLCSNNTQSFLVADSSSGVVYYLHSMCESDQSGIRYRDGCDSGDNSSLGDCNCPNHGFVSSYFELCPAVSLFSELKSQQTASKTNSLISESNSKLGVIASTSATITGLLKQIKDSLFSLNVKNFGVFGTNANSSDSSNKDNPDSAEYEPTLLSSETDVSAISPKISVRGSCPTDISISVMNSTHYLSYQPLCDFADKLNPLVIAAARVAAAWLVIGAL